MTEKNNKGLLRRRNSFPEIIRKPKIVQVKSLDIPINTSNIPIQKSYVPTHLPSCDTTTAYYQDSSHSDVTIKKIHKNKFEKLCNMDLQQLSNLRTELSTVDFYCKKCKMRQNLSAQSNSDDDGYQKVMPMSTPISSNVKTNNVTRNPFTVSFNSGAIKTDTSEKCNFNEIEKQHELKIQDIEDKMSSIDPLDSKRTIDTSEDYTESNFDLFVSDILTESLKSLPEGGGIEPKKCKTQFIESFINNIRHKQKQKKIQEIKKDSIESNSFNDHKSSKQKHDNFSNFKDTKKETEPTHLILSTELLKKLNVDFVLLNFGSVYSESNTTEMEKVKRNLNNIQRSDSLDVQPSSTANESSCSASEDSSSDNKINQNENKISRAKTESCCSEENGIEICKIAQETEKTDRMVSQNQTQNLESCNNVQNPRKHSNKEEKLQDIKPSKEKLDKNKKISVATQHSPCLRICPGLLQIHHDHTKIKCHHLSRTPVTKKCSPKMPSKKENINKSSTKNTIKKMTVFQTQSDIVTPDNENGPKRFYQKTEINDGEKRIEILEIVECESCQSSPSEKSLTKPNDKKSTAINLKKDKFLPQSKIDSQLLFKPVPKSSQKPMVSLDFKSKNKSPSSQVHVQKTVKNETTQTIPTPSPNCVLCKHQGKIPKYFIEESIIPMRSPSNMITRRRGTPGRSSDPSKYQQVFEVIPEEKSSISTDSSSTEDRNKEHKKHSKQDGENEKVSDSINQKSKETTEIITKCTTSQPSDTIQSNLCCSCGMSGFCSCKKRNFGKTANEECSLMPSNPNHRPSIDDDGSAETNQSDRSNQYTISSPSTATAIIGTATPKNVSATTFPTSSESCNIIHPAVSSFIGPSSSETSCSTAITNSNDLQHMQKPIENELFRKFDEQNTHPLEKTQNVFDLKFPFTTKTDYTWRVDASCSDENKKPCLITKLNSSTTSTSSVCLTPLVSFPSECFSGKTYGRDFQCSRCCFCNPSLHECSESTNSTNCLYCNRKKTPKLEEAQTNTECELLCCPGFSHCPYTASSDKTITKCTQTELVTKLPKSHSNQKNIENSKYKKSLYNLKTKQNCFKKSKNKNVTSQNHDNSSSSSFSTTIESESSVNSTHSRRNSTTKFRRKNDQKKSQNKNTQDIGIEQTSSNNQTNVIQNSNWSVTVTGTCQDMVPDVEMKLRFPKPLSQIQEEKKFLETVPKNETPNNDSARMDHLALPSNKKFTHRTTPDNSQSPDISPSRRQLIPSDNLKHPEKQLNRNFTVSAATDLISKNTKGRRTMSYHVISTHSGIIHDGKNCHLPQNEDFFELDDTSKNHRIPITCKTIKSLTITGNAIEPEQKPRVPTMSEKDLTRKYRDLNFTRNKLI